MEFSKRECAGIFVKERRQFKAWSVAPHYESELHKLKRVKFQTGNLTTE